MTLAEFLDANNLTASEFARQITVSPETVSRYCNRERVPRKDEMQRIFDATEGKVTPNDFYDLAAPQSGADAA